MGEVEFVEMVMNEAKKSGLNYLLVTDHRVVVDGTIHGLTSRTFQFIQEQLKIKTE